MTALVMGCRAGACPLSQVEQARVAVELTGPSRQEQRARVALGERDDPCDPHDFHTSGTERHGSDEAAQRS